MAVNFLQSRTKENLMRAFAGESQARNRYTIAAEEAENKGFYALKEIFLFTAEQERAHAARFYEFLKQEAGNTIEIDGTYPVDQSESLVELLNMAAHNERQEHEDVYPAFAKTAEEEGFQDVAYTFREIAEVEKVHGVRFTKLADMLKNETYYEKPEGDEWMCLNCGYIFKGTKLPTMCPVCHKERGYFIPACMAPYLGFEGSGYERKGE